MKGVKHVSGHVSVQSFGDKYGLPLPEANFVIDVRFLYNPYQIPALRHMRGTDIAVQDIIMEFDRDAVSRLMEQCYWLVTSLLQHKSTVIIAFGCTGGHHRSVFMGELFAQTMRRCPDVSVNVWHRDIEKC